MGKIADLVAPSAEIVETEDFWFKVSPLSVETAWREGQALGYAMGAVKKAEEPDPENAEGGPPAHRVPITPAQLEVLGRSTVKALCVGVIAMAPVPEEGQEPEWEPVKLVESQARENRRAEPPRIWVGAIQRHLTQRDIGNLAAVALEPINRALAEVRPLSETPGGS